MAQTTPPGHTCKDCAFIERAHIRKTPPYITYRCDNEDSEKWDQRVFWQTKACDNFKPKNSNEARDTDESGD